MALNIGRVYPLVVGRLLDEFSRNFGNFPNFRSSCGCRRDPDKRFPRTYVDHDNNEICFELPGMDKKDISVKLQDGYLIVEAGKEEENDSGGFSKRSFFGQYRIPEEIGQDFKASYKDGILRIPLPEETKEDKKDLGRIIDIE